MSRPLRLVPQAAQPIEFCCPLCGSVHAAYIFGTSQFRIFRCGGCALTFSKKATRNNPSVFSPESQAPKNSRSERDHAGLLASIDAAAQFESLSDRHDEECSLMTMDSSLTASRPGGIGCPRQAGDPIVLP